MPLWLVALAGGALTFFTDDYVIAGLLPEIARDLRVGTGAAGQLVTAFSVTVALAAPVAAIATAQVSRRVLLTSAASVFTLANALAVLAPGLGLLLGLRVLAGLAAAAATPALFSVAATLAPPEKIGRYVAVVAFGVTGSIAFGVPAGTWIGGAFGWRATFAVMAGAGLLVTVAFAVLVPRALGSGEPLSVRAQLAVLARPALGLGLGAYVVLMLGSMMLLTYLAPYAAETTGAGVTERGVLFAVSGLAGMLGIWAGGLATDAWGPNRALAAGVGLFVLTMGLLAGLWLWRPVPLGVLLPVVGVWAGAAFWNSPAVQARLHLLAGPVSAQALALNTSGTYLGVALGGALGGLLLEGSGVGWLPPVAALAGVVALGLLATAAAADPLSPRSAVGSAACRRSARP